MRPALIFEILLWIGSISLLFGYLSQYKKHFTRTIGYILVGIFWIGEAPHFLEIDDYFNAGLCLLVLPLFAYFGYHEYLSKKWEEDPEVMKFLAGGISIAMLIYFGIERIPLMSGFLIKAVSEQTVWVTDLIGYDFYAGQIHYSGNPVLYRANHESIYVPIVGSNIHIILACTGLQALSAAGALIYCTTAKMKVKLKSLLIVLPTLYVANIGRNALVIYLTVEGIVPFDVAHNEIAKTGSVIVLVILLLIVFELMPEFHDNIMSVLALPKRKSNRQKQQKES